MPAVRFAQQLPHATRLGLVREKAPVISPTTDASDASSLVATRAPERDNVYASATSEACATANVLDGRVAAGRKTRFDDLHPSPPPSTKPGHQTRNPSEWERYRGAKP